MSEIINDETAILGRVMTAVEGSISEQAAEPILKMRFDESDVERMQQLLEKNRAGEASESELEELERYSRIGNLINLLQSKVRRSLANG